MGVPRYLVLNLTLRGTKPSYEGPSSGSTLGNVIAAQLLILLPISQHCAENFIFVIDADDEKEC